MAFNRFHLSFVIFFSLYGDSNRYTISKHGATHTSGDEIVKKRTMIFLCAVDVYTSLGVLK